MPTLCRRALGGRHSSLTSAASFTTASRLHHAPCIVRRVAVHGIMRGIVNERLTTSADHC